MITPTSRLRSARHCAGLFIIGGPHGRDCNQACRWGVRRGDAPYGTDPAPIGFLDIVAMFGMELSKLSESLKFVSGLSGAPLDLLQWLTEDDILIVLAGLDQHMDNFNRKSGF